MGRRLHQQQPLHLRPSIQVLASLSAKSGGTVAGMQPRAFIPFRDSKLTQLLWDGLRGTGRALMLACLGPTMDYAEESLNTLHFASMALRIKSAPVVLIDPQVEQHGWTVREPISKRIRKLSLP